MTEFFGTHRFARVPLGGRVPHPTTLMKITSRCGEQAVAALTEVLAGGLGVLDLGAEDIGHDSSFNLSRGGAPCGPTRHASWRAALTLGQRLGWGVVRR